MDETDISRILRSQAWERAKGELRSVLCTFHSPSDAREGQFDAFHEAMEAFIKLVEDDGLCE